MLVRRRVFADVGLLDEGYFLYFEETDFCLQAARAGWACWYVPTSRVTHFAGSATGLSSAQRVPSRRPRYWFESRRRYFVKNHSRLYAAVVDLAWLAAHATRRMRKLLGLGRAEVESREYVRDFLSCSALRVGRERQRIESTTATREC
jgi:GT2 family glycosyltransferase